MMKMSEVSRVFFYVGIWHPKTEHNIGTLWRSAFLFGAAGIFTVGKRYAHQGSDTSHTPRHIPLHHYADLNDLVEHLPHATPLVGVELDPRATALAEYTHRPTACYLLGAEDPGLPPNVIDPCHDLVQIESARPWSMNVACAGTVLLHDRHVQ